MGVVVGVSAAAGAGLLLGLITFYIRKTALKPSKDYHMRRITWNPTNPFGTTTNRDASLSRGPAVRAQTGGYGNWQPHH